MSAAYEIIASVRGGDPVRETVGDWAAAMRRALELTDVRGVFHVEVYAAIGAFFYLGHDNYGPGEGWRFYPGSAWREAWS